MNVLGTTHDINVLTFFYIHIYLYCLPTVKAQPAALPSYFGHNSSINQIKNMK